MGSSAMRVILLSVVDLLLLLLSKDFLSGHFKKFEISFRALKPRPAHHGGQAVRSPEFAPADSESLREQAAPALRGRRPRLQQALRARPVASASAATASSRKMTARNRLHPRGGAVWGGLYRCSKRPRKKCLVEQRRRARCLSPRFRQNRLPRLSHPLAANPSH